MAWRIAAILVAAKLAAVQGQNCRGNVGATAGQNQFNPEETTIVPGQCVTFTIGATHNVIATAPTADDNCVAAEDNWAVDLGSPAEEETNDITFRTAGEYPYMCGPHCQSDDMIGKVVVATTPAIDAQTENTVQYYTDNTFTATRGDEQPFVQGECSKITNPNGGVTWRKYTCSGEPGVVIENNEDNCKQGIATDLQFDGTGAVKLGELAPDFFFVKCGDPPAAEDDGADLAVEAQADDSDDDAAIVGGAIGGVAVLAIGTGLWYRTRTAAKYKLVI